MHSEPDRRGESGDRGDFLVPRKAIELVEIVRKATKTAEVAVAFHENHAAFRIAMFQVSARLENAKFPAWEEVVPKKSKHELRVSRTDLLEALDRVAAAIGDRARGVVLHRTGDRLEIYGENPRAGELKTDIAARGWTDKAVIEVNLSYLYNAARFAPSDELRIGLTDDASPLKIQDGPYLALRIMDENTAGDPMSLLRWTNKSTASIAEELTRVSRETGEATTGHRLRVREQVRAKRRSSVPVRRSACFTHFAGGAARPGATRRNLPPPRSSYRSISSTSETSRR